MNVRTLSKRLFSLLLASTLAISCLVAGPQPAKADEPTTTEATSQTISVSAFGDSWYYYGRNEAAFFADSTNMSLVDGWTLAPTMTGFPTGGQASGHSIATLIATGSAPNQRGSSLYPWTYFKKTFELPADFDAADVSDISGIHVIDDALLIYVNGVKVYAYNISSTSSNVNLDYAVNFSNYAGTNTEDLERVFTLNSNYSSRLVPERSGLDTDVYDAGSVDAVLAALNPGTNVITCVVGQRDNASSDLFFDLQMRIKLGEDDPGTDPEFGALAVTDMMISPGSDESQLLFNYYTTQATSKIAIRAQGETDFSLIGATSSTSGSSFIHKVTVNGLLPSTTYEYRVIGESDTASAIFTVTTGNPSAFSFFAVGDPQIGSSNVTTDTAGWVNTINLATAAFPNASFLLSAGDQVETANSTAQYTGYLSPSQFKNLPVANAIGNHDSGNQLVSDHFNMPNAVKVGSGTTNYDYWFTYGDVLFLVLDANLTSISSHTGFLNNAIAANPDRAWTIVMFHQGPYVNASHRSDSYISTFRTSWIPVFDDLEIDLVINGHDHSYVRSHQMLGNTAQTTQNWLNAEKTAVQDPTGTLYMELNSGSGSKYYDLTTEAFFVAKQNQANRPNFSVVDVTSGSLAFTTYQVNASGTLTEIDSYTIAKTTEVDPEEVYAKISTASVATTTMPIEYLVSLTPVTKAQVVSVVFTADSANLSIDAAEALNGFQILPQPGAVNGIVWKNLGGGIWQGTVKLMSTDNTNGVTTLAETTNVLRLTGTAGALGNTSVDLVSVDITRITEENKAHTFAAGKANPTDWQATSSIVARLPVFSIYDLNRDGAINDEDLAIAWYYYLMNSSNTNWETVLYDIASAKDADVTGDGVVSLEDLIEILANYRASYNLFP